MAYEHKAWSPLWLEYSGLPQLLGDKIRGNAGWITFKKVVELDCAVNRQPGTVEISLIELSGRTGIATATLRKTLLALRKLKLIACYLPEAEDEAALMKIRTPLRAPRTRKEIRDQWPRIFLDVPQHFRYIDEVDFGEAESPDAERELQEIVDMYFNTVGLKINTFILDELRLVRSRFPADEVRRQFRRARENEIHSLHWVVKELLKSKSRNEEQDPDKLDIRMPEV